MIFPFNKALSPKKLAKPDFFDSPRARAVRSPNDVRHKISEKILSLRGLISSHTKNTKLRILRNKKTIAGDGVVRKLPKNNDSILMPRWSDKGTQVRRIGTFILIGFGILLILQTANLARRGLQLEQTTSRFVTDGFSAIAQGAAGINEKKFGQAVLSFTEAKKQFAAASNEAWFLQPGIVSNLFSDPRLISAQQVLVIGTNLSEAGVLFSEIARELAIMPKEFFSAQQTYYRAARPSLTEMLKKNFEKIGIATEYLQRSSVALKKIPQHYVPRELHDQLDFAQRALDAFLVALTTLQSDTPAILKLLGDEAPHTYLILLQNNAELRPTGGFIGNYIIAETNDGYLTKNEMFDVYFSDHQLNEVIEPPEEIKHINNRWYLRDSNYSPDFPTSAQKAAWFLEKENGPGVDTVIAIDKSLIEKALQLTGPIQIPEINTTLTKDNFTTVMSFLIESKYFGRQDPKVILKNFLPAFQKALFENVDPLALASLLSESIEGKNMLAYSKDSTVESFFEDHGVSGRMAAPSENQDYLNIVHTSIGGNKSDDYISEYILHDTFLHKNGSIENELTITRNHLWNAETEQKIRTTTLALGLGEISDILFAILGRSTNFHRLRIYVPRDSTVVSTTVPDLETKLDPETNLTYFSLPMQVPLSGSKTVSIRYKLPFKIKFSPANEYHLTIQKQPGQDRITLQKRIFPDLGMREFTSFPEGDEDAEGVWKYEEPLEKDLTIKSVWGK